MIRDYLSGIVRKLAVPLVFASALVPACFFVKVYHDHRARFRQELVDTTNRLVDDAVGMYSRHLNNLDEFISNYRYDDSLCGVPGSVSGDNRR